MKFRTRTMLQISLLAVLAGTFFAGTFFTNRSVQSREAGRPVLSGYSPDSIETVVLRKGGVGTELSRKPDGTWKMKNSDAEYPVSPGRIKDFLSDLGKQTVLRTVSRSGTNWKTFGVESPDTDYIFLEASGKSRSWKLVIGTPSSGGTTAYARNASGTDVYETGYSVRKYIDERPTYWQDLRIFPDDLKESAVNGVVLKADITIRNGDIASNLNEEFSLAKISEGKSTDWKIIGKDMKADQKEVAELVRSLVQLEGAEFLPGTGIEAPRAEITVSTDGGKRYRLLFGEGAGDTYPAYLEGSGYTYSVGQWRIGTVLRSLSSLIEKTEGS